MSLQFYAPCFYLVKYAGSRRPGRGNMEYCIMSWMLSSGHKPGSRPNLQQSVNACESAPSSSSRDPCPQLFLPSILPPTAAVCAENLHHLSAVEFLSSCLLLLSTHLSLMDHPTLAVELSGCLAQNSQQKQRHSTFVYSLACYLDVFSS